MRYAIILGRKHGATAFEAVGQGGVPKHVLRAFKRFCQSPENAARLNLAELHFVVSDVGIEKRRKFEGAVDVADEDEDDSDEITDTPTREDVLRMVAEIKRLTDLLASERQNMDEDRKGLQDAIVKLQAQLTAAKNSPAIEAQTQASQTEVAQTAEASSQGESSAASAAPAEGAGQGPALPLGGESLAEADETPTAKSRKGK